MKLENKVTIVTGAGKGIGKAISTVFAREGAVVVLSDIDLKSVEIVEKEIKVEGGFAEPFKVDVSDKKSVRDLIEKIIEKYGKIDILVNNAGIFSSTPIESMSEDEWDRIININLKGVFLCSQAVMKVMKKQKSGRIINISSLAAKVGGIYAGANYAASKAGVISLTKSLAKQLADYGITVNAVAPAAIDTDMTKSFPKKVNENFLKNIPLHRFGKPEEVAETVLFLASEGASFITGATLDINGGLLMD
jgi:3-oxoacyl-[acyl-carrier protein] reductase